MSTSKRTTEHEAQAIAWAQRGQFRPTRSYALEQNREQTTALLAHAGVDVGDLEERVRRGRPRLEPA